MSQRAGAHEWRDASFRQSTSAVRPVFHQRKSLLASKGCLAAPQWFFFSSCPPDGLGSIHWSPFCQPFLASDCDYVRSKRHCTPAKRLLILTVTAQPKSPCHVLWHLCFVRNLRLCMQVRSGCKYTFGWCECNCASCYLAKLNGQKQPSFFMHGFHWASWNV